LKEDTYSFTSFIAIGNGKMITIGIDEFDRCKTNHKENKQRRAALNRELVDSV